MNLLSSKNRWQVLNRVSGQKFDLIVVGGGVTGAGIALDAAARGLSVVLLEKADFASGTSSKSTKLIHGGLRYLRQFDLKLVAEVGRERAIVHQLAPHLVKAEKMLLPIFRGGAFGKWTTSAGLWMYDFLAGVQGDDRRKMISRQQVLALEPQVRQHDLLGGGLYAEYRTDDARLTIELIKAAGKQGAICLNYAKVEEFTYRQGKITGVLFTDLLTSEQRRAEGRLVVNAAGPWVDIVRSKEGSIRGKRLFLSKGVHLVVPHERLPLRQAVYFDVPGGRMMFAIPRWQTTYLGTTDTPYFGDPDEVRADLADAEYILQGVNAMFPRAHLTLTDVVSSWAGLRPLIHEEGKPAGEMSRKNEIFISQAGLLSIAGGKLTGYRRMAERVVDLVLKKLAADFRPCTTHQLPLTETPFKDVWEVKQYQESIVGKLQTINLPATYASSLVENYGKAASQIIDEVGKNQASPVEVALARSELSYCLENEMVFTPLDFFERRSGRLYFCKHSIYPLIDPLLEDFRHYFGWDANKAAEEKRRLDDTIRNTTNFT